jgi:tetratricopeptide (TPR) repeat protein
MKLYTRKNKPINLNTITMKKLTLLLILSLAVLTSISFAGSKPDKEVQKAFELRINGKVDEAKAMLEGILAKDSTNAMAHYEMARLKLYMLIGGGKVSIDEMISSANKAVIFDPKNVTYAYYKAMANFLNAFMGMQTGQGDVKGKVAETCIQFEKVLALKPDYSEAMLYLVEIYGLLPKDMGGDSVKAVAYAGKLANIDKYFGAKAKAVLAPESTDRIKYWEDLLVKDPKSSEYLKEAGNACLFQDDITKAEKYFEEAIKANPSNNILILNLARYHVMKVMQNQDQVKTELPVSITYFEEYLKTIPEPIVPLKAYTLGAISICERFIGNQVESDKLTEQATAMDKYFSRASGLPMLLLFDPPTQLSHHYVSFFSPF